MTPTWYDLLGVERDATTDEVRAAWRAAIADLDPSERRFRSLNQAAEVLLDDERRAAYDAGLPAEDPAPELGPELGPESAADPAPGSEPEPAPMPAPAARGRRSRWATAAAGVLAVLLLAATLTLWLRPHVDPDEVRVAQAAAERAIVPVLSYDYRDLERGAEAARGYLSDAYRDDYDELFAVLEQNAPETETVVQAEVVASSVVRTAPDQVDVLVFVNRPTSNSQLDEPRVFRDQVTVSMVEVDGEWLVDGLVTTPAPESASD